MRLAKWVVTISTGLMASSSMASGFALIEQSASGQGLSYAGAAASAEDASVMWFNPAGLTRIDGAQIVVAGHVILPNSEFNNEGSTLTFPDGSSMNNFGGGGDASTAGFVPNVYWKDRIGDFVVGLGIGVPYGQHLNSEGSWVGRYSATETDLKTVNINPAIATNINEKLSVGFGLNAQYVDVLLAQKVNQLALDQSPDGEAEITGKNWAFGYNLGLMLKATDTLDLGFSYRSKVSHDVEGQVKYSGINSTFDLSQLNPALPAGTTMAHILSDADASTVVDLPATASLAANYQMSPSTNVLVSTTWTGWSAYDELVVEFDNLSPDSESNQNFEDSMRYAVGLTHQYSDKVKFRTGVAIDKSPVPDAESRSPRTPDSDRAWVSAGVGYKISNSTQVDVAYTKIYADNPDINYTSTSSLGDSTLKGSYDAEIEIFSAQLVWSF